MVDRKLIEERIKEDKPNANVKIFVDKIIDNYIDALEPNLIEWINHQPMSDIYIGELTLNMIFQAWGWVDFGDAYEWLQAYMRSGFADTFFILERNAFLI
ncbi:MAG: hypothetical protein IJ794_06220 [Lachnospiraceae bacterium]|nr:hypothetical protein [Lachnospiraceae bacterium]